MNKMLYSLYSLLLCHFVGDYVLQTDYLAKTKGDNPWHLLAHCMLYTLPFWVCYGLDVRILILCITHFCIDISKARYKAIGYAIDQMLHILILLYLYGLDFTPPLMR